MRTLDQLPCAVLVTDASGRLLDLNTELLALLGQTRERWLGASMDDMLPPAGRIFLQTHIFPTLLRDGRVIEIHLQIKTDAGERLPVLLNGRLGEHAGRAAYMWTLFAARERHRFEAELVAQRNRAESASIALEASERFTKGITWPRGLLGPGTAVPLCQSSVPSLVQPRACAAAWHQPARSAG
jgi:diguanylate cyclase